MEFQLKSYFDSVILSMEKNCTSVVMENLIKKLEPLYVRNNCIVLKTPSDFYKETIENRYLDQIIEEFKKLTGQNYTVKLVVQEDLDTNGYPFTDNPKFSAETSSAAISKKNAADAFLCGLIPKYIFDTFVKGKSNELAYSAALAVSRSPGQNYNPLFLYGGVGLGKTHLMHSIGNHILETTPEKKILYCSSETFTNELINSIKNHKNQEFRNKYRDIDVLLIDDIQFLSDKEGTQEEFFHTFNSLYGLNKQIVISSDQPPKDLKTLEDRLRSRFGSGLTVDITLPDFETRTAILEKKADLEHLIISKEVTKFIAKNVVSNIRDLEGALNKVTAYARLVNADVSLELAEKTLRDIINGAQKRELTVEYIQEVVAHYFNITMEDLKGKKRNHAIVVPRQIAMYLSRKLKDVSLPQIGRDFGGRDHSTVSHSCDKITAEMDSNSQLRTTVIELETQLKEN